MNTYSDKTNRQKASMIVPHSTNLQKSNELSFQLKDNRPEAQVYENLKQLARNNTQVSQLQSMQNLANNANSPIQLQQNKTGLPNNLKSGIEQLSGFSMNDVKVHYNSDKPAQLQAHAYAQGTDIHLASGQEKHLPHEAWHVVQQKQGRVQPTKQLKGKVNINDNAGLEQEADVMGEKAMQLKSFDVGLIADARNKHSNLPIQRVIIHPTTGLPYKAGTLATSTLAKKGLTEDQQILIQQLHDDPSQQYTVQNARERAINQLPTSSSSSSSASSSSSSSSASGSSGLHSPPFPWRYGAGNGSLMETTQQDQQGFVASSSATASASASAAAPSASASSSGTQIALASHDSFSSLPSSSRRAIQQTQIMEISPNVAARNLGLVCPSAKSWEWLHLVAFSIRPTHLGDFPSAESVSLMKRTGQPQQISENLVLGTEAANTAMLTYETIIKRIMRANPTWKLRLFAASNVVWHSVGDVRIPLSQKISYHFIFIAGDRTVSPPVILTFDTLNHIKPTRLEFSQNVDLLTKLMSSLVTVPNAPSAMITSSMAPLTKNAKSKNKGTSSIEIESDDFGSKQFFLENDSMITLNEVNYRVVETGGDGHCMYTSALFLRNQNRNRLQELRTKVADRLVGRISPNHINGVRNQDDGDVNIDLPEVAAILNCRFVVHAVGYDGGELQRTEVGVGGPIVHIVHQGNHFMALIPQ